MKMKWLILLAVICVFQRTNAVNNDTDPYLRPTLRALRAALEFLEREHSTINLDAVIGTRIVEGQLKVLLRRLSDTFSNLKVPDDVLAEISNLKILAGYVSERALPYIIMRDTLYFTRIGDTLSRNFWDLDYESRDVNPDVKIWPYANIEYITEKNSDDCLTELFGTGKRKEKTCSISNKCWTKMTKPGYNGYSLTHEIFYLQIGKQFGCEKEMKSKIKDYNQKSIDYLEDVFCTVILTEANKYSQENLPDYKQDLFMEQAALCGMLGYREFFNTQWLLKILSWQDRREGCYKPSANEILLMEENRRVKREEKDLKDHCLSHRTTVAAAALGQYIRYILETWADTQPLNR